MDTLRPLVLAIALADGTFLHGFIEALQAAGLPTTAPQWGGVLAWALAALWLRYKKGRADARRLRAEVQQAVAGHLATITAPADALATS